VDEGKPEYSRDDWHRNAAKCLLVPGFMAFSRIIGLRIANGQSLDAFRMLADIGAPPELAHRIVEGWPLLDAQRRVPQLLSLQEEAALRLSFFVPNLDSYDWVALLRRAAGNALRNAIRGDQC